MVQKLMLSTVGFILLFSCTVFAGEKLKAITCNFEPFYGESMKNQGPISEITHKAFQEVGYEVDIKFVPWARALAEAEKGDYDILVGVWHSAEREKWMAFSDAMMENELGFYKKKGDPITFTDYAALKANGTKIGIVRGYVNPEGFDEAKMNVDEATDDLTNMRKFIGGRTQLVIIDKQIGAYIVKSNMADSIGTIEWLTTLQKKPLMNGILKNAKGDWQKRLADFNKGIGIIKQNGTLDKILKEHGF